MATPYDTFGVLVGKGSLAGQVTPVGSLKPMRTGDDTYLVLPDLENGDEWAIQLNGYTPEMFQPPADLLDNQQGAGELAARVKKFRDSCNWNMDGQGWAESDRAKRTLAKWNSPANAFFGKSKAIYGDVIGENFTPLWVGARTMEPGNFANDGALHNAADDGQWTVQDPAGYWHGDLFHHPLFSDEHGNVDLSYSLPADEFAWVVGLTAQLPVTDDDRARGFDGKVILLANKWTHQALIIGLVNVAALDVWKIAAGALEILVGVVVTVVTGGGGGVLGVPLIMLGAGTIANAWDNYTQRAKATQNGFKHSTDPAILASLGHSTFGRDGLSASDGKKKDMTLVWAGIIGLAALLLLSSGGKGT